MSNSKASKARNDARPNGKAAKKKPGSRGSRSTKLTEAQKTRLGGGLLVKWDKLNQKAKRSAKRPSKRDSDE